MDFDNYLSISESYYDNAVNQVYNNLPPEDFIFAMEGFYGLAFKSYTLIPSLTVPTDMGFGVRHPSDTSMKIYNIFGPLGQQKFDDNALALDMGYKEAVKRNMKKLRKQAKVYK